MKELSRAKYARLSHSEQIRYLEQILGDSDDESLAPSDSDDEDWFPAQYPAPAVNASDNEDSGDNECEEEEGQEQVETGNGDSETEQEQEEDRQSEGEGRNEEMNEEEINTTFVARDKTVWSKVPLTHHQTAVRNIVRQRAGAHRSTENLSICDTFKKIMSNEMIHLIVRCTNKKALAAYEEYNNKHPEKERRVWENVTSREMYAFLGILIGAGANNSNTDRVSEMWKSSSYPLYRATMGINRFKLILRFIRFDDSNTRQQRLLEDKAAPIRDLWNMLNANLCAMYRPTENLTIDEQLFPYRGKVKFTQYIPSKPAKYGIKVWWICDAENSYPLKGFIYTGKTGNAREVNQGEMVAKELAVLYKGSGRNICMDDFFTSLPLAKHLLSWNLTIVGTLKKNKPYIPKAMAPSITRKELSTLFGFHEKAAMCSYVPKKNKAVILISTMHSDMAVSHGAKKEPEMMLYYNKYKGGVDTMDHMLGRYTTHRRENRWPLAFFYNIVDIACIAAYLIYYENNKMIKKRTNQRRIFLRQLSEELAMPIIEDRSQNMQIIGNYSTKLAVESILDRRISPDELPSGSQTRLDHTGRKVVTGSCHICYKQTIRKRRKTRKSCVVCNKPVCDEHAVTITQCKECAQ